MEKSAFCTEVYIKRAIELGLIQENQYEKVYRELDSQKSIL